MVTLHRPGSVDEACRLLTTLAEPLAYGGGTAIQILVRQGVLFPSDLVDLAGRRHRVAAVDPGPDAGAGGHGGLCHPAGDG